VTLRQLMGHLSGVRNDGGDEGPLLSARCERPVEGLQPFAERSLLFEPGTQYRYSSYGWILVSAAVEAAADEPFLTFMRKQIFEPLGMDDTRMVGHDGESLGGMVASLMTFPEQRIVVSVMSNISYADTYSLAVTIAQAFAGQSKRPARK
jgi:hypothetical protein